MYMYMSYVHVCACTCKWTCACACVCMYVHVCACMCVCVCTVEGSVGSEAVESCKSHSQVTQGAVPAVQSSHVRVRERLQRRSVVGLWSRWAWVGRIG
jgi:hypothetical protein